MTPRRLAHLAALALLASLALSPASAQSGPPPGYTDPLVYAQDYATGQAEQAQADPAGYAGGKATPEGAQAEAEHAAWLACWTAYDVGQQSLDPVCSQFFTAPGVVDAPAEAEAEITSITNGTGADALLAESLDAVNDTVADPTSAASQVQRIVEAVKGFAEKAAGFVVDLVKSLIDAILDLAGLGGRAALDGLGAMADGLLALLGLPLLGLKAAGSGLASIVLGVAHGVAAAGLAVAHGLAAAGSALVAGVGAVADGLLSGYAALGHGLSSVGGAVADAADATVDGIGDAASAVGHGVSDAAHAVRDTVAGWFGDDQGKAADDGGLVDGAGVDAGQEADGLLDRVFGLL